MKILHRRAHDVTRYPLNTHTAKADLPFVSSGYLTDAAGDHFGLNYVFQSWVGCLCIPLS